MNILKETKTKLNVENENSKKKISSLELDINVGSLILNSFLFYLKIKIVLEIQKSFS
jgi:hypothetical protein